MLALTSCVMLPPLLLLPLLLILFLLKTELKRQTNYTYVDVRSVYLVVVVVVVDAVAAAAAVAAATGGPFSSFVCSFSPKKERVCTYDTSWCCSHIKPSQ